MKIDEFKITRYGPLPDSGRIELQSFNLFFGENEDGKTLAIDALVKLMFGQNIKDFERIDRVEESPEGYVVIRDDKNKEIKIPEKGTFTKITNLTPSECRNVFIIRNSDLQVSSPEGEFYTTVANRLVGLRTDELSRIEESLREIGKITPNGSFEEGKDQKLKSRIKKAGKLVEKIQELTEKMKDEDFDKLEREELERGEEIEQVKHETENLENARKREKYEKGKRALERYNEDSASLCDLERYEEEDEQLWRDCTRESETHRKQKEEFVKELEENQKDLTEETVKLAAKRRDFGVLQEVKKKLDDEVRLELRNYETKSSELALQKSRNNFLTTVEVVSTALLFVSLIGVVFSSSLMFYVLVAASSLLTVISWTSKFQYVRNKARLSALFEKIRLSTSKHDLGAETAEQILSKIQKFDEEYAVESGELQEIERRTENFDSKIGELQNEKIPKLETKIDDVSEKIGEIRRKSGEESLPAYMKKLRQKEARQKSMGEQERILENLLESKSKKSEENSPFWAREISELEEYRGKAKDTKYKEATRSALKEKQRVLEAAQEEAIRKMSSAQERLAEKERETNEILRSEEYLCCKTYIDLEALKNALQRFVDENESNRDNVLQAIRIFDEIRNEEKNKVSDLFGDTSSISEYFKEITDGLYNAVYFKADTGEIRVKRRDGVMLEAEKLSGGAYDQLYLSIRLALGERLLKGNKAFFIMDDPFIKADKKRLQNQMNILKRISNSGWQILYFTAKDEIKDALKEDLANKSINYIATRSIVA